jgi:hypothetical protein
LMVTMLNLEVTGLHKIYIFRRGHLACSGRGCVRRGGKSYCSGWPVGTVVCRGRRDDHNLLRELPHRRTL